MVEHNQQPHLPMFRTLMSFYCY